MGNRPIRLLWSVFGGVIIGAALLVAAPHLFPDLREGARQHGLMIQEGAPATQGPIGAGLSVIGGPTPKGRT